jgi:hypothetical protein
MVWAAETVSTGCSFSSSGTSTPGSLLQDKKRAVSNITTWIKKSVFIGFFFFYYNKCKQHHKIFTLFFI